MPTKIIDMKEKQEASALGQNWFQGTSMKEMVSLRRRIFSSPLRIFEKQFPLKFFFEKQS
jgi:hypothetical protein